MVHHKNADLIYNRNKSTHYCEEPFFFLFCRSEKKYLYICAPKYLNKNMAKIFTLSEAASIALHSMVIIARAENGINAVKIADSTGFSKNHISKVLQRLVKSELLKSIRGPAGGFSLKKPASEINMLEVYQSIEGPIDESNCPLAYEICNFDRCIMGNIVNKMTLEFRNFLQTQTLAKYL